MKIFRLTKRDLVSSKSYALSNYFAKLPMSANRVFFFFSQKTSGSLKHVLSLKSQIQLLWQEVWKPALIVFKTKLRLRVSPTIWLIRDTISILAAHIKATVMPALWHLRYSAMQFATRIKTESPIMYGQMRDKTRLLMARIQPILSPISRSINNKIGVFISRSKVVLYPILAPINNKIGLLTARTRISLSPVGNKLTIFTPSVKNGFNRRKASFFSFFAATYQLTRKEALTTNLISVTIVVFCTMVYIKRKETVLQNTVKYGFHYRDYTVVEDKIKEGDVVYSMLVKYGLSHRKTDSLLTDVRLSYNFDKIQVGRAYTALVGKDSQKCGTYLVFEPDPRRYFVFDLKVPSVKEVKRDITYREFETSGVLKKTLYSSLLEGGLSYTLIDMVQDALKDKMDIRQCANGDEYKLIWEEELIDGKSVGVQKLTGLYIKGQCIPKPVYAFYYNNGKMRGWYQKDSLPVRDGFIDTPVLNSTITSHFDPHRLHPILHYRRPHLGTDFAAPKGSPIMSVADGVVEEAKYGGGNGRYVKIKHKKPYETQYLHMSRFATGIEPGTTVKQKQVIGYIGMSGLTTGPHVCFRFWKDGIAIDHLTEKFYTAKDSLEFKKLVTEKMSKLEKINVLTDEERLRQKAYLAQLRSK